jgi:signal transduction histidine kinase
LKKPVCSIFLGLALIFLCFSLRAGTRDGFISKINGNYKRDVNQVNLDLKLSYDFLTKSSEQSLRYAYNALILATQIDYEKGMAKAERFIGDDYVSQGNYTEALGHLIKALDLCELADDDAETGSVYIDLGEFNLKLRQYKKAIAYYEKAADIFKKKNIIKNYTMAISNMASAHQKMGNNEKAIQLAHEALATAQMNNDTLLLGDNFRTLAGVFYNKEQYDSAKTNLDKAYFYYNLGNDDEAKLNILQSIGNIYLKKEDPIDAQNCFQKVLNKAEKAGYSYLVTSTYQKLSQVDSMTGNYVRALSYFKRYVQLNDSTESVEKTIEISKINDHRDLEIKQRNIEELTNERDKQAINIRFKNSIVLFFSVLLPLIGFLAMVLLYNYNQKKEINTQLSEQKEELQTLNTVKDRLFSIISHDLRSPLANLEAILKLMESGDLSHEEVMMLSSQLTHNVQETSYMLDNLLQWSKSQMRGILPKKELVNIPELCREVVSFFNAQADKKAIDIRISKTDSLMTLVDKEMIKLVLRNLVANAIKFTPSGGTIGIEVKNDKGQIIVSVTDSGIGMADSILEKLFTLEGISTQGTQNEKGTGLGLLLCKDFIELNNGKIWAESTVGKGSIFYFSLPITVKPSIQEAILAKG